MKHVGKMKNNSARLVVVFRTLPGDPHNALVVGTQGLPDSYHDTLMTLIESENAQSAYELGDILSTRRFPDGSVMLNFLHEQNHLKKIPTNMILMTPDTQNQIPLDELNKLIATQKGVALEDLAITDGSVKKKKPAVVESKKDKSGIDLTLPSPKVAAPLELTPTEMRDRAKVLIAEAERLQKEADKVEAGPTPAVKKTKKSKKQQTHAVIE